MTAIEESKKQDIIQAIRSDEIVGRGTCSEVDECHTDDELVEAFGRTRTGRLCSPAQAVKAARAMEKFRKIMYDEVRATAF
jgi:hypothetical protein